MNLHRAQFSSLARRDRAGRFLRTRPCDACGKPVGTAYFTDEEVCGASDGPGFYLCERRRCVQNRSKLSIGQRRALYERMRRQ